MSHRLCFYVLDKHSSSYFVSSLSSWKHPQFFFFLFGRPVTYVAIKARDQIQAIVMTQATAMAMPDPETTVLGKGSNLCPKAPKMLVIPLQHSRSSVVFIFIVK